MATETIYRRLDNFRPQRKCGCASKLSLVEQRLQVLEDKIDQLLKLVDPEYAG